MPTIRKSARNSLPSRRRELSITPDSESAPASATKPDMPDETKQGGNSVKRITLKIGGKKDSVSSEGGASATGSKDSEVAPTSTQKIKLGRRTQKTPKETPTKGPKKKSKRIIESESPVPTPEPSESPLTEEDESSKGLSSEPTKISTTGAKSAKEPRLASKSLHSIKTTLHLAAKSIPTSTPSNTAPVPSPEASSPPLNCPPPKAPTPPPTIPAPVPTTTKPLKSAAFKVKNSKHTKNDNASSKPSNDTTSSKSSISIPSVSAIPKTKIPKTSTSTSTPIPAVASSSSTPIDNPKKRAHPLSINKAKPNPPTVAPPLIKSFLQFTLAKLGTTPSTTSTPSKSISENSFKKIKKEPTKDEKHKESWRYIMTPEEQAEYDSHAPRRDAERAARIAQAKNGMNLNFARDTYKLDAMNRHNRDIDFNGAMSIETSGIPEKIMVHLFGDVIPHGDRKRAEAAAAAAQKAKAAIVEKKASEESMEVEKEGLGEGENGIKDETMTPKEEMVDIKEATEEEIPITPPIVSMKGEKMEVD